MAARNGNPPVKDAQDAKVALDAEIDAGKALIADAELTAALALADALGRAEAAERAAADALALADAATAPAVEPADAHEGAGARRRRESREAAKKATVSRYTLDADAEWRKYGLDAKTGAFVGEVGVCRSTPNAQGETFLYVVHRQRGREIAIPLLAVDALMDAGDL